MAYQGALLITGPTTSGKTDVAFQLARKAYGEVICADMFKMYRDFPLLTGLYEVLQHKDINRHLYDTLEPRDKPYKPGEYAMKVDPIVIELLGAGKLPVIEGSRLPYLRKLRAKNRQNNDKYSTFVGLISSNTTADLKRIIEKKVDIAISEGIVDVVRDYLRKGYQDTLAMKYSPVSQPIVDHLTNGKKLSEAKYEIVTSALALIKRQSEVMLAEDGIEFIEHDHYSSLDGTVEKILKKLPK